MTEPVTAIETPSTNGDGRDRRGRFQPGHKLAKGNPFAGEVQKLRKAALAAVTAEDMAEIFRKQVEVAKTGDGAAARFVADYTLGKPGPVAAMETTQGDQIKRVLVVSNVGDLADMTALMSDDEDAGDDA